MPYRRVEPAEALEAKYPEWLVFVLTADESGRADIMPAGWCMSCGQEPPLLAVALKEGRHTLELIRRTGEFNLAWAAPGQHDLITATGTCSGREVDKFARYRLTALPAAVNRAPLLDGCAVTFECRLRYDHPSGDHRLIVGEIVAAHLPEPRRANAVNFGGWYAAARPEGQ